MSALSRVPRAARAAMIVACSLVFPIATACNGAPAEPPGDRDDAAAASPDGGSGASANGDDGDVAADGTDGDPCTSCTPCTPRTCETLGYSCGTSSDGCGGTLHCGTCTAPSTCSGGGAYNQCGTFPFQGRSCFMTCSQLPDSTNCNQLADGCGHLMTTCGSDIECSVASQGTCGGGGIPFHCGSGATCKPLTCADLNYNCGEYGDGCTGSIDCGPCPGSEICGGGGFNRCGPKVASSP